MCGGGGGGDSGESGGQKMCSTLAGTLPFADQPMGLNCLLFCLVAVLVGSKRIQRRVLHFNEQGP